MESLMSLQKGLLPVVQPLVYAGKMKDAVSFPRAAHP